MNLDQSNLLDVDFASFILSCGTLCLVLQQFFKKIESFCDEIDMILNNPIVTILLDNDIVLMIETI